MTDIKSSITETHDRWHKGHIEPFWSKQSYTQLNYTLEGFNNPSDMMKWKRQGYVHPISHYTGFLCDMRKPQPAWNDQIIKWFEDTYSVTDIGTSYYRMGTGVILPTHKDTYKKYRELFNVRLMDCVRVVVYLEDWRSGHISEVDGVPVTNWRAGDYIFWESDTPHLAANIGLDKRFTLQLTGHRA